MRNKLIAERYVKAILMNVDENDYTSFREDIVALEQAFSKDLNYIKAIDSLIYPLKKRLAVATEITKNLNFQQVWHNLFTILIKKHRFSIIEDILLELKHKILESKNQIEVKLTIAHEHPDSVIKQISKIIQDILKKDVELKIEKNPDIIGGFIAQTNSLLIDGSIKNNLAKLIDMKKK